MPVFTKSRVEAEEPGSEFSHDPQPAALHCTFQLQTQCLSHRDLAADPIPYSVSSSKLLINSNPRAFLLKKGGLQPIQCRVGMRAMKASKHCQCLLRGNHYPGHVQDLLSSQVITENKAQVPPGGGAMGLSSARALGGHEEKRGSRVSVLFARGLIGAPGGGL